LIVVDSSVLAPALIDSDPDGAGLRAQLAGHELVAPQILDLEVMSVYRRHCRSGKVTAAEADLAVQRLSELPLERFPHTHLTGRVWELRHNVTSYDAAYIALAEALHVPLWTRDHRLANAPGIRCQTVVPAWE
jgi:predicted nucleic acid-binding protein